MTESLVQKEMQLGQQTQHQTFLQFRNQQLQVLSYSVLQASPSGNWINMSNQLSLIPGIFMTGGGGGLISVRLSMNIYRCQPTGGGGWLYMGRNQNPKSRSYKLYRNISKFIYLLRIDYSEQKPPQLCHTVCGVKFTGPITISFMRIFFEVDINSEFGANFYVCSYTSSRNGVQVD